MTPFLDQVRAALRAVTILNATQLAWCGRPSRRLPAKTRRALDAHATRAHLVSQLQQSLYLGFYVTGAPVPDATPPSGAIRCADFIEVLSRANCGDGCWTSGWLVRSVQGEGVIAERDGLRLRVPAGSWRAPDGARVCAGANVEVMMPKEQLGISPGFYLAHGNVELATSAAQQIVRLYFNTSAAGGVMLMASLTRALNGLGIAFRFKVMAHPACFTRCDAAVLYLRAEHFERAAPALACALAEASSEIGAALPAFAKPLAPGVGLAEDPDHGESFGWHRSGLLAEAIVRAHEHGVAALDRRVELVRECFTEAGLSLDAPYLSTGSRDRYDL